MMDKFCKWWERWSPLIIGPMWIFLAICAIGVGETRYGPFLAFLGMFWWAIQADENRKLQLDFELALNGWQRTIDGWQEANERAELLKQKMRSDAAGGESK